MIINYALKVLIPFSVIIVTGIPRQRKVLVRESLNPELLPLGAHDRKEKDYG